MLLRNQGIKRKSLQDYDIEFLTSNFRLSDLNCALGYSQLKSLKKNKSTKLKILKIYNKLFSKHHPYIKIILDTNYKLINYHLYCILIDFQHFRIDKKVFINRLNSLGINTQIHYIPLSELTLYKKHGKYDLSQISNSYDYNKNTISLPFYVDLTYNDVIKVYRSIISCLTKC